MRKVQEINSGSMADIAFLLLVFFLVTASINQDFGIKTQISKPYGVPDSIQIIQSHIWVNSTGSYMLNDVPLKSEQLAVQLAEVLDYRIGIKNVITVKADRDVSFDDFITALDRSKKGVSLFYDRLAKEAHNLRFIELNNSQKQELKVAHSIAIAEDVIQ